MKYFRLIRFSNSAPALRWADRLVFSCLYWHRNHAKYIGFGIKLCKSPSIRQIARATGLYKRTVSASLSRLVELGLVRKCDVKKNGNVSTMIGKARRFPRYIAQQPSPDIIPLNDKNIPNYTTLPIPEAGSTIDILDVAILLVGKHCTGSELHREYFKKCLGISNPTITARIKKLTKLGLLQMNAIEHLGYFQWAVNTERVNSSLRGCDNTADAQATANIGGNSIGNSYLLRAKMHPTTGKECTQPLGKNAPNPSKPAVEETPTQLVPTTPTQSANDTHHVNRRDTHSEPQGHPPTPSEDTPQTGEVECPNPPPPETNSDTPPVDGEFLAAMKAMATAPDPEVEVGVGGDDEWAILDK